MDVLEEVTEDNLVRYMEGMDVGLEWFVEQLRGLGGAMGDEFKFLRKLEDGEEGYELLDVVEGIGKVVRGKVLADTAHKANGLPGWVQAFLDMLRRWVEEAGALMKLGAAVNEALKADADGARRLDEGFRGMVEELVAQDVEWLRGLQAEAGREAQGRVMAAGRSGVARVREERPITQEAEAKQGEAVRRAQEAEEDYKRAADEEASAAMELAAGEQPGRVDAREMDLERGRELAQRFHAVERGEAVVCRVEDGEYEGVTETDIYASDSKVARGALKKIVKALATEPVTFSDGTQATVSGRTRGEVQQHMADRRVVAALAKIRELAARGVYLYSAENEQVGEEDRKKDISSYHYYLAKGDFGEKGRAYVCVRVAEYADGSRVYDLDVTDEETVEQNKEEAQFLPATRIPNTGPEGEASSFMGRVHETKKFVNYIDRVSQEKGEGEVSGNSEQVGGESSMSVAEARERGLMKDGVMEVGNGVLVDGMEGSFSVTGLHASPALFRLFSTKHVGEGTFLRYGWGLYFGTGWMTNRNYHGVYSGKDRVYEEVRRELVEGGHDAGLVDEVMGKGLQGNKAGYTRAIKAMRRMITPRITQEERRVIEEKIAIYERLRGRGVYRDGVENEYAVNYRAELDVDDGNVLQADEPVEKFLQEHPDVAEGVRELGIKLRDARGGVLYRFLVRKLGSPKAASEWLDERGIRGIKYEDGMGEGKFNYVIFNADYVTITHVNNRHEWSEYSEDNPDWQRPEDVVWEQDGEVSFSAVDGRLLEEVRGSFREEEKEGGEKRWVLTGKKGKRVVICGYPDVLKRIVPWERNVVAANYIVKKLLNEHDFTPEDVGRLPYALWDPIAVFEEVVKEKGSKEGKERESFVVVTDIRTRDKNGKVKDALVILMLREDAEGARITDLKTAYAPDAANRYVNLLEGKALRYVDKARARRWGKEEGSTIFQLLTTSLGKPGSGVMLKENMGDVNFNFAESEFSGSIRLLRDGGEMGRVTMGLEEAGRSFKKNEAFVQQMLGEMRKGVERMRRLAGKGRTKREEALAVMGGMVGMVKAVRLYLPKGFGFSVEPYVRQLEVLCELATTGRVELADPIKRVQKELEAAAKAAPDLRFTIYDLEIRRLRRRGRR